MTWWEKAKCGLPPDRGLFDLIFSRKQPPTDEELYDLAYPVLRAPVEWLDEPVEVLAMSATIDVELRELDTATADFGMLAHMININEQVTV